MVAALFVAYVQSTFPLIFTLVIVQLYIILFVCLLVFTDL